MKGSMKKALIIALAVTVVAIGFGSTDVLAKSKKKATATHNVTYVYGLKSVTVQVPHGGNATIPLDVAVDGYTFTGWVGSPYNVTEDRTILGAYSKNPQVLPSLQSYSYTQNTKKWDNSKSAPWPEWWKTINLPKGVPGQTCAVHWYNAWTGEIWRTDIVPYGTSIATPPDPCISGYEFSGWQGDWNNITEDRAIAATYYVNHTVTFDDPLDEDPWIDKVRVRDGEGAWVEPPHHDGYEFKCYRRSDGSIYDGGPVHYDMTVTADYEKKD